MERVFGIGGVFFKSKDPERLTRWYVDHLGVPTPVGPEDAVVVFRWLRIDEPHVTAQTVWAPFPQTTDYFGRESAALMINFQVQDLDAMLAQLRAAGVEVDARIEQTEQGRFGWCLDPEGNRIELWQPPAVRDELLSSIRLWRDAFERAVLAVPAAARETPGVEEGRTVKDLVGHVLFWEQRALTLVRAALGDEKAPSLRLPGEEGEWIHRLNAEIDVRTRARNWDDLWSEWTPTGAELLKVVGGLSERDLFAPDGLARILNTPAYDIIANNTFDHYGEHLVNLRGWSGSRIVG